MQYLAHGMLLFFGLLVLPVCANTSANLIYGYFYNNLNQYQCFSLASEEYPFTHISPPIVYPLSPESLSESQQQALPVASCAIKDTCKMATMLITTSVGMLTLSFMIDMGTIVKLIMLSATLFSLQGLVVTIPVGILITVFMMSHKSGYLARLGTFLIMQLEKMKLTPFIDFADWTYSEILSPLGVFVWALGKSWMKVCLEGFLIMIDTVAWFLSCGIINIYPPSKR